MRLLVAGRPRDGREWSNVSAVLLGAIALACLAALVAGFAVKSESSLSYLPDAVSRSGAVSPAAELPSELQAAIDRSLAAEPVTSSGGVRLWWDRGGAVSLATRASGNQRVTLRPDSIARIGSSASRSALAPAGFVFAREGTSQALGFGVTASYRVTGAGVEQRFRLEHRVAGRGALVLTQRLSGQLRAEPGAGDAISFHGRAGELLSYRGLRVTDAGGKLLRSRLELGAGGRMLRIVVDDRGAAYPLTIDPTFLSLAGIQVLTLDPTPVATLNGGGVISLGYSVALSADGRTAVVGAPAAGGDNGEVLVYTESSGGWPSTPTATFTGSGGEALGSSVAISADGRTVVAGAPSASSANGAAVLYSQSSGVWSSTPAATFTGSGGEALGSSVAIAADGQTVVAGAPGASSGSGAVALYSESSGAWSNTPTTTFTGSPGDGLGSSVAISADGQAVVAGAPTALSGSGAVALYSETSGAWSNTPAAGFTGSGAEALGTSVAISGVGTAVVAGAPSASSGNGAALLYVQSASAAWSNTPTQTFTGSGAEALGGAVAISGDGETVVAGAPGASSGAGAVNAYDNPVNGSWSNTPEATITGSSGQHLGASVAASADGQAVDVGVPEAGVSGGAAMVYGSIAGGWSSSPMSSPGGTGQSGFNSQIAIAPYGGRVFLGDPAASRVLAFAMDQTTGNWIQTNDLSGSAGDQVGASVALSRDGVIVAGGPGAGSGAGEVKIFDPTPYPTGVSSTLTGSAGEALGSSVAVSADGQTVVSGASGAGSGNGAVAVYRGSAGNFSNTPVVTLTGSAAEAFGSSVAISADGETLAVGAPAAASGSGAVFVYHESSGVWSGTPVATFTGSGAEALGSSVAISADGQTVAAGAPAAGSSNGAVSVYTEAGGSWSSTPTATFAGSGGERLGYSLALSADARTLVAGAPSADSNAGAGFLYSDAAGSWSATPAATFAASGSTNMGDSVAVDPGGQTVLALAATNSYMFRLVPATTIDTSPQTASYSSTSQTVALSASVGASSLSAGTLGEGKATFTLEDGSNHPVGTPVSGNVSHGAVSVNYTLPAAAAAGSYTIDVSYSDSDGAYADSSDSTQPLTVQAATTATAGAGASTAYSPGAQTVSLSAAVTSGAGTVNEGSVLFTVKQGTTVIGTATSGPVSSGSASVSYALPAGTAAGDYTIVAAYSDGAGNYTASSDSTQTLTVGAVATGTAGTSASVTYSARAQTVPLTAAVTSGAGTVNEGSVLFTVKQGTTVIGTATSGAVSSGSASVNYALPGGTAAGGYSIVASYSDGGGNFTGSSDSTRVLTVQTATTSTAVAGASLTYSPEAQTVPLTATVTSAAGVVNEGSVLFTVKQGATVIGTASSRPVSAGAASVDYALPAGTAAGSYTIDTSYSDAGDNFAGSSGQPQSLTVGQHTQSVSFTPLTATSVVVGQSATLAATGSASGQPVELTVDPGSSPAGVCSVAQTASGTATVAYHHAGTCVLDATQAASSDGNYAAAPKVSQTVAIGAATTTTALTVAAGSLSAAVSAVAPGAGTPAGTVSFSVDGNVVGTATLTNGAATLAHRIPAGASHQVSATYLGTADYTGSSASTARRDPVITAHVSSARPRSRYGWYSTPVRISFSCRTDGAPLTGACPAAVTLTRDGAGQSLTRTINAGNGGAATVTVKGIQIDRVAPVTQLIGARPGAIYDVAPTPRCGATDKISGVASCTLRKRMTASSTGLDTTTVSYTLTATDRAGNSRVLSGQYRVLGIYIQGAPYVGGSFLVHAGQPFMLIVSHTGSRPRYIDAAPAPSAPAGNDNLLHPIGAGEWAIGVRAPMAAGQVWDVGVLIGHSIHQVPIRES